MKKILFPLFIFVGTLCFGQDYLPVFADKDSVRFQIRHTWGSIATPEYDIWTEKESIDSLAYGWDSTEYKVYEFIYDFEGKDTLLVREDTIERKIFAKTLNESGEHLIYDFSLKVDSTNLVSHYTSKGNFRGSSLIYVKDQWVENYAGKERKVQLLEVNTSSFSRIREIEVVEGIGTKKGFSFLFTQRDGTHKAIERLACLFHDGVLKYTIGNCYLDTTINPISNIQEFNIESSYKIYPNPTMGKIGIYSNVPFKEHAIFRVLDINGILIRKEKILQGAKSIYMDLNNISPGIYFYQIEIGGVVKKTDKFLIIE